MRCTPPAPVAPRRESAAVASNARGPRPFPGRTPPRRGDKASRARILYMRFEEYPDRWHEIWDVFSREAVWSGKYDQFAASKRKRGTSEVDDEFLKDIEDWREKLARNVAMRNAERIFWMVMRLGVARHGTPPPPRTPPHHGRGRPCYLAASPPHHGRGRPCYLAASHPPPGNTKPQLGDSSPSPRRHRGRSWWRFLGTGHGGSLQRENARVPEA